MRVRTGVSRVAAVVVMAGLVGLAGCGPVSAGSSPSGGGSSSSAAGGSGSGSKRVSVVASTNVWGDVAAQVGGDHVHVRSIISDPDQDPHSYEANTKNQAALAKAKVVIENGGGYDDFVPKMLSSANNSGAHVVNAVTVSGKKAPKGEELNEHVWYDVSTVTQVADQIADALGKAEPADKSVFQQNAAEFDRSVKKLESAETKIKKKHGGDGAAITEPVPLYLLSAAGLKNKTPDDFSEAVEEGDDVSARTLHKTLNLFDQNQVQVLAYNSQTSGAATTKVLQAAKKNHIPVVPVTETLPKKFDSYQGWMTANLSAIRHALETS